MKKSNKTIKFILIVIILLIIIIFVFNFVRSDENSKSKINFLNNYAAFKESSLMKTPNNEHLYYYQKGWIKEKNNYLMVLPKSKLRFFSLEKKKRTIYMELSKNGFFKNQDNLEIQLFFNGIHFENLKIKSQNSSFLLSVSEKFIKKGNNILEIIINKHNYDKQDQLGYLILNKFMIKEYKRTKEFIFNSNKTNSTIVQPSQSQFEYYMIPKGNEIFNYSFKTHKVSRRNNISAKVLINLKRKDKKEITLKKIELSSKKNQKHSGKFKLNSYAGEIIKLSFIFLTPKPNSTLIWENLFIAKKEEKNILKNKNKLLKRKPHIFLILIDAARYDRFGFSGYKMNITPKIDAFAKTAFDFSNFYAQAPYTTASVASMLSGLYPETHTVRYKHDELPKQVTTISQYLNKIGYITNSISGSVALEKNKLIKNFKKFISIRSKVNWSRSTMDIEKLNNFINNSNLLKPNFFYIHLLPPHEPYNPPSPFNSIITKTSRPKLHHLIRIRDKANRYSMTDKNYMKYLHNCYLNNLIYADHLFGEIVKTLKEKNIFEDSLVIISSDHGEAFFEHLQVGHNTTNYNDMIQIPFVLKMPNQNKGIKIGGNFGLIDLSPTILELLGVRLENSMQGISFSSILFGEKSKFKERFLYSRAVSKMFNFSIIYGNYKYIYNSGRGELYNIKNDPDEKNDISNQETLLSGYLRQQGFYKMYRNIKLREQKNIKRKKVKNKEKYKEALKSLGYI